MSERMMIANTILMQLGGNKFKAMTGAKNLMAIESGLSFKLPGRFAKGGINYVKIELEPSDTYTVTFGKVGKYDWKVIYSASDIYNDMLQPLFKRVTGLDTSL